MKLYLGPAENPRLYLADREEAHAHGSAQNSPGSGTRPAAGGGVPKPHVDEINQQVIQAPAPSEEASDEESLAQEDAPRERKANTSESKKKKPPTDNTEAAADELKRKKKRKQEDASFSSADGVVRTGPKGGKYIEGPGGVRHYVKSQDPLFLDLHKSEPLYLAVKANPHRDPSVGLYIAGGAVKSKSSDMTDFIDSLMNDKTPGDYNE